MNKKLHKNKLKIIYTTFAFVFYTLCSDPLIAEGCNVYYFDSEKFTQTEVYRDLSQSEYFSSELLSSFYFQTCLQIWDEKNDESSCISWMHAADTIIRRIINAARNASYEEFKEVYLSNIDKHAIRTRKIRINSQRERDFVEDDYIRKQYQYFKSLLSSTLLAIECIEEGYMYIFLEEYIYDGQKKLDVAVYQIYSENDIPLLKPIVFMKMSDYPFYNFLFLYVHGLDNKMDKDQVLQSLKNQNFLVKQQP